MFVFKHLNIFIKSVQLDFYPKKFHQIMFSFNGLIKNICLLNVQLFIKKK